MSRWLKCSAARIVEATRTPGSKVANVPCDFLQGMRRGRQLLCGVKERVRMGLRFEGPAATRSGSALAWRRYYEQAGGRRLVYR